MVLSITSSILKSSQGINQVPLWLTPLKRLHHQRAIAVTWARPKKGFLKLNFDGSYKGQNGKASIGGLVRNHKAEFLAAYAECIGKGDVLVAECRALKRGLEILLENGWGREVWVEGDAKTLVEILRKRKKMDSSKEMSGLVGDINERILELEKCTVTHIYREGNRAADKLARMGRKLGQPWIWRHVPPPEIERHLREDAEGKIILRRR